MNVIVDRHTEPTFSIKVQCSYCKSKLELDNVEDFHARSVSEGSQWDPYDVLRLFFKCCLCGYENRLGADKETSLPLSVLRRIHEERQVLI